MYFSQWKEKQMLGDLKAENPRRFYLMVAGAIAATCFAAGARAASISDSNSTLTINPISATAPFITNWVVDGVDQYGGTPAGSEQLTYSVGSGFSPVNTLTVASSSFANGIASVTYDGSGSGYAFTIAVQEILSGGNSGSGASAISETISVTNTLEPAPDSGPLAFTLGENVNLNIHGTPANDTLTLSPASGTNTAEQTDPSGAAVNFTTTPAPNGFKTVDVTTGTASNSLGPVTGDEAFSATYDMSLISGNSEIVSNNFVLNGGSSVATAVPLPNAAGASLAMLAGLGIFGIVRRVRRMAV
jgi:hypothetical protein